MAYNNNIPQPNDDLSVSQPQILANFAEIATAFNLNHGPFNSGTEGKHAFVEMPNQNAAPPVTIANEVGLYCNTSAFTTQPELFLIKQLGSTVPPNLRPPIAPNGYEISGSNYTSPGWTRLPSGILLKWGTFSTNSGVPYVFDVAATIPPFAVCYNVQLVGTSALLQTFSVPALTNLQFTVTSASNPAQGYYFAIGV
jgi:hypothetical protein